MFTPRGVNHIAFFTKDMDATVKFYTEVLNMPLVVASYIPEAPGSGKTHDDLIKFKHYFFDCGGGNNIAFFTYDESLPPGYGPRGGDAHHIAFAVRTVAELEDARQHIMSKGYEITPIHDHGYIQSIYMRDPNGIVVELSTFIQPASPSHPHIDDPDPVPAARAYFGSDFEKFYMPAKIRQEELAAIDRSAVQQK